MAIYVGENNALLLKNDRSVVELYKGDKKIFGYNDSAEGKVIAVNNSHPIEHKLKVEVKSKNLFDEQLQIGGINTTTGENNDNVITTLRAKNYIKVFPSTVYFVACPIGLSTMGGLIHIYRYDENKNFLGYGSAGIENQIITTGADWHYIRFVVRAEYGTVYNNDICISLSATPTEYTPYITDFSGITVTRCGKNLLEYPYVETTLTRNGITFTDNGDGTITANGTATADTQFRLQDKAVYPKNYNPFKYLIGEKVFVLGSPDGSSKDTYGIQSISIGTFTNTGYSVAEHYYRYAIFIKSGMTVENLVFKPVIFLQNVGFSNDFEQYDRQTVTANADGTVKELTSRSPNMTLFTDTQGVTINCEYVKG